MFFYQYLHFHRKFDLKTGPMPDGSGYIVNTALQLFRKGHNQFAAERRVTFQAEIVGQANAVIQYAKLAFASFLLYLNGHFPFVFSLKSVFKHIG